MEAIILKEGFVRVMIDKTLNEQLGFVPEYDLDSDKDSNDLIMVIKNLNDIQIKKFEHVYGEADEKYLLPLDILGPKLGLENIKMVNDKVQLFFRGCNLAN